VNAVFRHLAACCLAELHLQEEEYALSGATNGIHPLTISKYSRPCNLSDAANEAVCSQEG